MFAKHHYLSGTISRSSRCYLALWDGTPVAFCATLNILGQSKHWRISRIVTLPDYQGIGIGMKTSEAVARIHRQGGLRMNVTASHPALIAHCRDSPLWRTVGVKKTGTPRAHGYRPNYRGSAGRSVVSFEFVGDF
ncbi:MAG: GNAT family N-acetyltransferase [Planctomycetes bacterium]|nr:GNAT family N-acetyltransferase [Planctomycetota bacterium]